MTIQPAPGDTLDPREEHYRIPSPHSGLRLFLRHLPATLPSAESAAEAKVVLFVHGGTFPSALSVAHRFDGRSWRDVLCAAGYDVWALDFHGFGALSDPHPEMSEAADRHPALGRAEDASHQLEAAVRFIGGRYGAGRPISIIAHSWGTMAAGRFAGRCPDLVDRLVLFGPIARRPGTADAPRLPAWKPVTLQDQWDRFVADTPKHEAQVLLERHFQAWGERYLGCDPGSCSRTPPAVKVPLGPIQDIYAAWAGDLVYDPGLIRAPVGIVRGAWDSMCTDADANRLFDALTSSPLKRDVKLGHGGHLMHFEEGRYALYRETLAFLDGNDTVSGPAASGRSIAAGPA